MFIATLEDVVLAKLEWAKLAKSERQIEDVAAVLKIQWNSVDREYLNRWIRHLNIESEWSKAKTAAAIVDNP